LFHYVCGKFAAKERCKYTAFLESQTKIEKNFNYSLHHIHNPLSQGQLDHGDGLAGKVVAEYKSAQMRKDDFGLKFCQNRKIFVILPSEIR